ncbi:hypothetical protein [Microbacterium sp. LWH10-1.2]|uniref:hypothetical protein n=1 Tax=Microbacterium sp. LWH10-1.2 TaxID=3135255 RepID=UPI003139BB93
MFVDEYRASTKDLASSLPTGASFPATPPGEWEPDGVFEEGVGSMQAALIWQCTWIGEYQRADLAGDATARSAALAQLDGWTELPAVAPNVDAESVSIWHRDVIGAAEEGDDSFLTALGEDCVGTE